MVAGHQRYPGAPRLAAEAALRMGAGLVRLVVPESIYSASCTNPALMVAPHYEDGNGGFSAEPEWQLKEYLERADCLVIGPGMGTGDARKLVRSLLETSDIPTVVDADALPAAWGLDAPRRWPLLLTPHAGELARLLEQERSWVEEDPVRAVRTGARQTGATVLLKGATQLVAASDGGPVMVAMPGPAWTAQAGSGDVLGGVCAALLAAGLDAPKAGQLGASVQAVAAARHPGVLAPQELARAIGQTLGRLQERARRL